MAALVPAMPDFLPAGYPPAPRALNAPCTDEQLGERVQHCINIYKLMGLHPLATNASLGEAVSNVIAAASTQPRNQQAAAAAANQFTPQDRALVMAQAAAIDELQVRLFGLQVQLDNSEARRMNGGLPCLCSSLPLHPIRCTLVGSPHFGQAPPNFPTHMSKELTAQALDAFEQFYGAEFTGANLAERRVSFKAWLGAPLSL